MLEIERGRIIDPSLRALNFTLLLPLRYPGLVCREDSEWDLQTVSVTVSVAVQLCHFVSCSVLLAVDVIGSLNGLLEHDRSGREVKVFNFSLLSCIGL